MVEILHEVIEYLGTTEKSLVVESLHTNQVFNYSLGDLGLTKEIVTQALAQFWSCAQGRIVGVVNSIARTKANPIPDHLLPNKGIVAHIRELWTCVNKK